MTQKRKTVPLDARVRASEARKIESGGRRLPGGVLPPEAAQALDALVTCGYARSATACIVRAVLEAQQRVI